MKKVKFIALALVLMLGLIGGAYAAWDDTIVLSGTANTGDFSVRFSNSKTSAEGSAYDGMGYTINDGVLEVTMTDLYPRAEDEEGYATLTIGIQNDGKVPAALKGIEVSRVSGSDTAVYNALKVRFEGDRVEYLKDLESVINEIIVFDESEVLEPNEYSDDTGLQSYLVWEVFLCEGALNNTQNVENVQFEVKLNFIQANLFDWEE